MIDLVNSHYAWIKSAHLVCVILWVGPQTVLPLLLSAHRDLSAEGDEAAALSRVERVLVNYLMNPAIVGTFMFGGLLAAPIIGSGWHVPAWLGWKLGAVLILAALHGRLLRQYWRAGHGEASRGGPGPGWVSALHLSLLVLVVVLVVIRPG